MAGFQVVVLLALIFMLFSCEGQVQPPSNGSRLIFLPQTTVKIDWSYVGVISEVEFRNWYFNSSDGSRTGRLARIVDDGDPGRFDFNLIPRFEINKPATLELKNVDQNYNGKYTFTLQKTGSVLPETSSVVVFIAKKPTLTLNCTSVTLSKSDDFICECKRQGGNFPASVTWYKDNNQMLGKTGTEKQILTLIKVNKTDSGTYKCMTESYADPKYKDEKSITINVRFEPTDASIELNPNPATLGQSFTITCSSRGFPEPSYKISHNGSHLISTTKSHTISNVAWRDAGEYECNAVNGVGIDKTSKILKITKRSPTTQKPPIPTTNEKYTLNRSGESCTCSNLGCDSSRTVVVWHIAVTLLSGIIIGILFSYIVSCSRRRWCKNRKTKPNSEPQTDGVDTTYQDLDLTKMNKEDNYQSLRRNVAASASNDVKNGEESTYSQLGKTRDVENNYQSLT